MLDQLVESRTNSAQSRRNTTFLLGFGALVLSILLGIFLWSLIAKASSILLGSDLELSSLVAPVALPEEAPPPPEVKDEPKQQQQKQDDLPTRVENIARMDESPPEVPDKVSNVKPTAKERPKGAFKIGSSDTGESQSSAPGPSRVDTSGPTGPIGPSKPVQVDDDDDEKPAPTPPPKPPTPKPTQPPPPKNVVVSRGVANGSAISLPKPAYPPTAKAVGASGAVNVQISIDENGNVTSASATTGHPLLRAAAAAAARGAKFKPTLLSGVPVKSTGVIVYNFN
jgi:protein TonB